MDVFVLTVVAIVAGIAGSTMSKMILLYFSLESKFKDTFFQYGYAITAALAIAAFAFFIDERVFGSGKVIMSNEQVYRSLYRAN